MLWWLAEELIQALQPPDDLGAWLQSDERAGLVKGKEKTALVEAAKGVRVMLKAWVEGFIKAAAEGLGKAVVY